jgi:hypothetical protein
MKFAAAFFLCMLFTRAASAADSPSVGEQMAAVRADENAAIEKVVRIVNQPVTHLKRDYGPGRVAEFSPGWFHDGAETPDFNTVDVRATQQLSYASHPYVSSDLNPTEMFIGAELEFNSMTKYFYTDRSLPKKRLTQAEMLEINRLYRIIGADEKKIAALRSGTSTGPSSSRFGPVAASIFALSLAAFFFLRMKRKTRGPAA